MIDHIISLLREQDASLADVAALCVALLRAWGVRTRQGEWYGSREGDGKVIVYWETNDERD